MFRLSALTLAVGISLTAGQVAAQQTAGAMAGLASKGDVISVENKSIGINRRLSVDEKGVWQFTQLPPGEYDVVLTKPNGEKQTTTVLVTAGQGANVVFASANLQSVVVKGRSLRSIDVASTTTSFTLSKAEIERIPVPQNVSSVALLAPAAVAGDGRFGNLASISGSSVAENAYYINGFNVTNIVKGIAFNEVPFQATGSVAVLNGGYSAEYGRSLGGVVSVTTKRGTNEWKGGGSIIYSPNKLRESAVYAEPSQQTGKWNLLERPGYSEGRQLNVYASGPIIEDQLFFFGLFQSNDNRTDVYGQDNQTSAGLKTPEYLVKLDWNLNSSNLVEFTSFSDKSTQKVKNFDAPSPYTAQRGTYKDTDEYSSGGSNNIIKWTNYTTDDLTISALYGTGNYSRQSKVSAADCPAVYDGRPPRTSLEYKGCWSENNLSIDDPNARDKRTAWRLDAEWLLGDHTLKAGLDNEDYTVVDGSQYTGGFYDRLFTLRPGQAIAGTGYTNTTGANLDYVRHRVFKNGGTFTIKNSAWYVEDNFKVSKTLVLNLGLRNESFENLNDQKQTFIKVKNTWAPRMGFSWDMNGDKQTKLYANAGRYYIPVYGNTNVRLSGTETFYTDFFAFTGQFSNDAKQVPGYGPQLGTRVVTSDGSPKDPRTVVDPNIKPLHQDELILGFQQALADRWTTGAKFTYRKLRNGMDDVCEGKLAGEWAAANGYSAAQAANIKSTIGGCFLYNPGADLTANVDLDDTGKLTAVVIPAAAMKIPAAKREFKALEFMAERQWDKVWSAQVSYVLAYSKGNTEGYVKSDNGQDDAGITQDFDHPGLMEGADGYLPNDRRHTIKANGAFAISEEWRVALNAIIQSGRPKNCFGNYAGPISDDSPLYGASSFYCNGKLAQRGSFGRTPWTRQFDVQFAYAPNAMKGLTLTADVFNIFNTRTARGVQEVGELDAIGSQNPTYGAPLLSSLLPARSVRLTAAYDF